MAKTIKKKAAKKAAKKIKNSKKLAKKPKKKAVKKAVKKPKNFMTESWESPFWDNLKKRGVDRAVLKFEGGGDDGCVHECELYHADGLKTKVECFGGSDADGDLVQELGGPIWERYGGFNWFEHCSGELVWNVKKNQIEWSGDHEILDEDY